MYKHLMNFGRWFSSYASRQTDRQTNKYILITILRTPPQRRSNNEIHIGSDLSSSNLDFNSIRTHCVSRTLIIHV